MNRRLSLVTMAALAATLLASLVPLAAASPAPEERLRSEAAALSPGSYLTVVDRGPDAEYGGVQPRNQRLVLISPTGETRTILAQKPSRRWGGFRLVDWSADGSTALLESTNRLGTQAIRVDIASGTTQVLQLDGEVGEMILDPNGSGIVVAVFEHGTTPFALERVAWAGTVTKLPAKTAGLLLAGPGETLITGGARNGQRALQVVSLVDGSVQHLYRPGVYCNPVRWWDEQRVLMTCGNTLSLFDPATGERTALTTKHGHESGYPDLAHLDARVIKSGVYVQVAGPCGTTFVSRQAKDGTMHALQVPHAVGNVVMVDGVGRDLVIQHAASCDGARPRQVLSRYNPLTREEKVLVELGRHESFEQILVMGEVRASAY